MVGRAKPTASHLGGRGGHSQKSLPLFARCTGPASPRLHNQPGRRVQTASENTVPGWTVEVGGVVSIRHSRRRWEWGPEGATSAAKNRNTKKREEIRARAHGRAVRAREREEHPAERGKIRNGTRVEKRARSEHRPRGQQGWRGPARCHIR